MVTLRSSCKSAVARKIRKNRRERPSRTRKQNIAISFSQVRKSRPECKRHLNKRFNKSKQKSRRKTKRKPRESFGIYRTPRDVLK